MSANVQHTPQTLHLSNGGLDFSAGAGGSAAFLGTLLYFSFKMGGLIGAGLAYGAVLLVTAAAVAFVCHRTRKQAK